MNKMPCQDDMQTEICPQPGIKLRMEKGNLSKRRQPDHRTDNNRRSPMGLQCTEKFPYPESSFSWPINKYACKGLEILFFYFDKKKNIVK